jgi:hypothetical protein
MENITTKLIYVNFMLISLITSCHYTKNQVSSREFVLPNNWQVIKTERFSLSLPNSLKGGKIPGNDTIVWEYKDENLITELEFGFPSGIPDSVRSQQEYKEENLIINNRNAKLVTFRSENQNVTEDYLDKPYTTVVHFNNIDDSGNNLTCWILYKNEETKSTARQIVASIKIEKIEKIE